MPATNKNIRTLRDIGNQNRGEEEEESSDDDEENNSRERRSTTNTAADSSSRYHSNHKYNSHQRSVKLAHIPTLFENSHANALLQRIHKEFTPIIQKRGYNILSISEMCCCGDGLDGNNKNKKSNIMPSNVGGYNQTQFRGSLSGGGQHQQKSHTIHLRLRNPTNHDILYDYDHIAMVMCHELSHCEVGPHNSKFYKLMDEIKKQHFEFVQKGIVLDKDGFPMGSDVESYRLGSKTYTTTTSRRSAGNNNNSSNATKCSKDSRLAAANAALQRQQSMGVSGPQRLGGASDSTTAAATTFGSGGGGYRMMKPNEAAAMAAMERRRIHDETWCQPCEPEIIDILSSDDDEEEEDDDGEEERNNNNKEEEEEEDRKPAAVSSSSSSSSENDDVKTNNNNNNKKRRLHEETNTNVKKEKLMNDSAFVDLTISDDDEDGNNNNNNNVAGKATASATPSSDYHQTQRPRKQTRRRRGGERGQGNTTTTTTTTTGGEYWHWSCDKCTFRNTIKFSLICSMCGTTRQANSNNHDDDYDNQQKEDSSSIKSALDLNCQEQSIEEMKNHEVAKSIQDFGFNIYGTTKDSSGKMDHIT